MTQEYCEHDDQRIARVTVWGMLLNLFLSIFKFAAGIWGGSQAVVADAVHSLSDMVTDLAILVGVRFWKPPADADHPYGHKKVETVVTLFIGIILGLVGLEIMSMQCVPFRRLTRNRRTGWRLPVRC
jgi:cation diffusion facilitator family transporter